MTVCILQLPLKPMSQNTAHCTVHFTQCIPYTIFTANCTMLFPLLLFKTSNIYTADCILYTVKCTMCFLSSAQCTQHSAHSCITILSDVSDSVKGSCKPPTKAKALVRSWKLACIAD